MRIPNAIRDCVGFLAEVLPPEIGTQMSVFDPFATGFCVSVEGHYGMFFYFVTAAHNFKDISEERVAVLVNRKGGGVMPIEDRTQWRRHSDASVDAAVLSFNLDPEMDVLAVPSDIFVRSEWMGDKSNIGIGSDVFSVGLFSVAPGKERNIPLIRYGNIAMLPDAQVQVESGFADVYLVEARSIGGMSGSPVFVLETVSTTFIDVAESKRKRIIGVGDQYKLLGLMHGHWDIDETQINRPKITPIPRSARMGVNLGIGVVVPAPKLLEILYSEDLVREREAAELEYGKHAGLPPIED